MFQNNELMKKIDYIEEASGFVIKDQRERSKSSRPKRDSEAPCNFSFYFCKKPGYVKKNCMIPGDT